MKIAKSQEVSSGSIVDVVGVGFGPSNMALAIALEELSSSVSQTIFFEKQPSFGWHRGMLIEDATMQISFLKDLVTIRNPMSRYSFISYLVDQGRISDFINSHTLEPSRIEFHDYLEWVAGNFESTVRYDANIVQVKPVFEDGFANYLDVISSRGEAVRTRNLVIGAGLVPYLPPGVVETDRVWHSSRLMEKMNSPLLASSSRIIVVGAGQSAAEVVCHLYDSFPELEVCGVFSRYGYSVADDSPFVNGIFDPSAVDDFYGAPENIKEALYEYHANTNYSAVDLSLSQQLYQRYYRERVMRRNRLRIIRGASVKDTFNSGEKLTTEVTVSFTGATEMLEADALVYATGYRAADPALLLGELTVECKSDICGRLVLDRDYRVSTSEAVRCGIYINGGAAEHTHGLSAGLLSNTAVRSGEIADSIVGRL
jgi:L-ornithine N5-monooxygenase